MAGGRGLLMPPRQARAGAAALQRLLDDPTERARHVEAGVAYVREHTLQAETARLAEFLDGAS
jgi:glycosyltransferase involved in cell wall biosynthesis